MNVAPLTSMATGRSSLTSCVFSNNSASNTPESRPAALATSVMALKDSAVQDKIILSIDYEITGNGLMDLRKNIRGKRSRLKRVRELKIDAGTSWWPLAE